MKLVIALLLAAATTTAAAEGSGFPNPANAWFTEGAFVAPETVRLVQLGQTRGQVRALLGPPHFGEGIRAGRWNYLLNFYTGEGTGHVTCQLQLGFKSGLVDSYAWSDPTCAARIAPKPVTVAETKVIETVKVVKEPVDIVIKQFSVPFAHDSSKLSAAARGVIDNAVSMARTENVRKTTVVGSADRTGSNTYNLILSSRRAKAVESALSGAGVPLAMTTVAENGEDYPAVPTPDGVANAANRRVVITLIR